MRFNETHPLESEKVGGRRTQLSKEAANRPRTKSKKSSGCTRILHVQDVSSCLGIGFGVRSILEHADENNSMKTLSQKHQPAPICINGNWPPSTRLLGLEPVTSIESRGEIHKGNWSDSKMSRCIMLKFSLILPSNLLDRSDFRTSKLPILSDSSTTAKQT